MIIIELNNNTFKVSGPGKETNTLYKALKIKHPQAFHIRKYMPKGWDGCMDFMSSAGTVKSGLLERFLDICKEKEIEVEIADNRIEDIRLRRKYKPLLDMRDYQQASSRALIENKVRGFRWPRGLIGVATNGGKTYISADIHNHYQSRSIFLMNSKELYEDAIRDMPKIIKSGTIGWISSKEIKWGDFMICMIGTVRSRLDELKSKLATYRVLIVDEGDLTNNKSNKQVISAMLHTVVRVALSGSFKKGKDAKLKQNLPKVYTIEGLFGKELYGISNRELIDKGVSSEVQVKFVRGFKEEISKQTTGKWMDDMTEFIVKNKKRNKKALKRSIIHWEAGRKSQLIISQRQDHILRLYKIFTKYYGETAKIEWVHHKRKDRFQVTQDFMDGNIDILIGSMILKRGKNFKKMDYMLNAGGGKSFENITQLLGRAFRGCKHYEDFWDDGMYLKPWSRKRARYYKDEKITVINKYK